MRFKRAPRDSIAAVEKHQVLPYLKSCCGTTKTSKCTYQDWWRNTDTLFSSRANAMPARTHSKSVDGPCFHSAARDGETQDA
eukprot:6209335-Pleurochrysis_carterae.AAC.1